MNKTIFGVGVIIGVTAIALGAFGAHGLKSSLSADEMATFETGVKYQMYHALFLLVLALINGIPKRMKTLVFYLVLSGVVLFSFSIYFLATNSLTSVDFRSIGFVTPLGGLLMITAWILLGIVYLIAEPKQHS